ncbi:MAG TPA: hypothetical protein VGC42_08390 [Kofleriaceae bacterium]
MPKSHAEWHVAPHRPLEQLSSHVWRLEGELERTPIKRVMAIAKRKDGGLIVHSAIAADEPTMAELAKLGPVRAILVPNGFHRLDAPAFRARFPEAEIICPPGAREAVEEVVPVSKTYDQVASDGVVELQVLDGTGGREGAVIVRDSGGTTLVLNDLVFNMPHVKGLSGFVLRFITGSTGTPKVTRVARMFLISDKRAARAHLEKLAKLPDLKRIIVSHHAVIDQDPGAVLAAVASTL